MFDKSKETQTEVPGSGSELTEAEKALFAELGIPESLAHLAPEVCTCGVDGCTEHQSWGDKIMNEIFKDFVEPREYKVFDLEAQIEELKNFKFPDKN